MELNQPPCTFKGSSCTTKTLSKSLSLWSKCCFLLFIFLKEPICLSVIPVQVIPPGPVMQGVLLLCTQERKGRS